MSNAEKMLRDVITKDGRLVNSSIEAKKIKIDQMVTVHPGVMETLVNMQNFEDIFHER